MNKLFTLFFLFVCLTLVAQDCSPNKNSTKEQKFFQLKNTIDSLQDVVKEKDLLIVQIEGKEESISNKIEILADTLAKLLADTLAKLQDNPNQENIETIERELTGLREQRNDLKTSIIQLVKNKEKLEKKIARLERQEKKLLKKTDSLYYKVTQLKEEIERTDGIAPGSLDIVYENGNDQIVVLDETGKHSASSIKKIKISFTVIIKNQFPKSIKLRLIRENTNSVVITKDVLPKKRDRIYAIYETDSGAISFKRGRYKLQFLQTNGWQDITSFTFVR